MDFKTYFEGSLRRRMKTFNAFGNTHYDGVLWYPRIAVYDKNSAGLKTNLAKSLRRFWNF